MSTAESNRFIRPKESKHGYRGGGNSESGADEDWTRIRIWQFGCSLTNLNQVMCENWMSVNMLRTKKTATAGIWNSNLADIAHKNGESRVVDQVFSVLLQAQSATEKRVLTQTH